jgi:class 3 adenylate cyclase
MMEKNDQKYSIEQLLDQKSRLEALLKKEFTRLITVMFTDIVGSTSWTEEAGDMAGRMSLKELNDIILPLISAHNGVLVKTMGDGTLSYFNAAQEAVRCAVAIQRGVDGYNREREAKSPHLIRIGLHSGNGIVESNDIFGDVVNVASRIETLAPPGGIYISEDTLSRLADKSEFNVVFHKTATIKGKKEVFKLYTVAWKDRDAEHDEDEAERDEDEADKEMSRRRTTLDTVHSRMLESGDFPAMSRTVEVFKKLPAKADYNDVSIAEITNTILNDFALTNKLLRLVNTAFYTQYDGKVTTISRALMLLGFIHVRNAALSLMMFENIQNKELAENLKLTVVNSFMSAAAARELSAMSAKSGKVDPEEAFICALFHDLGRMVAAYYLPEDGKKISSIPARRDVANAGGGSNASSSGDAPDEDYASRAVLGLSYEELGISIAEEWHLPPQVVASMRKPPAGQKFSRPETEPDRLHNVVHFSTELCRIIFNPHIAPRVKQNLIEGLVARADRWIGFSRKDVSLLIGKLSVEFDRFTKAAGVKTAGEPFFDKINGLFEGVRAETEKAAPEKPAAAEIKDFDDTTILGPVIDESEQNLPTKVSELILQKGIYEVTNTLLGEYTINDILRMILEIMYRGMDFFRVLICIRNTRHNAMEGRFGFGVDISTILKTFRFPLDSASGDVFNASLNEGIDFIVTNTAAPDIRSRIPNWYHNVINAQSFTLLPIIINKIPLGLIYADKIYAGQSPIPRHYIWYLKTLRKQAILAFKQKL